MRRTKEDWLAAVAGLTPYANMHWPSEVGGELGVPMTLDLPRPHPDMRLLWGVWGLVLVGFVLLATGVTGWVMVVALAGNVVLLIRGQIRLRIGVLRERRLRAEIDRRAAG
jgi:hypothetical protein